MNSQLYTAASGLIVEQRRMEMIANNLANLSTTGFRARRSFSTVFQGLTQTAGSNPTNKSVALAGSYGVPGPGPLQPTGRGLDVAVKGEGLLVVETASGRRYTRDGGLAISRDGELVDARGNAVLNTSDARITGLTAATRIESDGRLVDGELELGRLQVVRDPRGVLEPERENLLTAAGRDGLLETIAEPELSPGTLEGSGTDALQELVQLIDAQRAFESYQKLISVTMNEVNRRAVNDIAG